MVTLPRGLLSDGRRVDAEVRGLTGRDEEFLAARGDAPSAAVMTALLTRCVVRLGDGKPTSDDVRGLAVGDREALLLHVRRETLGDRIDAIVECPDPACAERLDLTLSTEALLVDPVPEPVLWHEETFASASGEVRLGFRLPNGGDQEAVAERADDASTASRELLARCLRGDGPAATHLADEIVDAIAVRMAELDPQAEVRLAFECAACGRAVETLFDTASFFLAEVAATADRLFDEVHAIAWHYHWSETQILALPRPRRRRYLDLIAASVGARQVRGVA